MDQINNYIHLMQNIATFEYAKYGRHLKKNVQLQHHAHFRYRDLNPPQQHFSQIFTILFLPR
jgi:hypothetical protein